MCLIKKSDIEKKEGRSSYFHLYDIGFLDATKVIVVVFENGEFNYYSAVDFGLTKIPVEIESILTDDPDYGYSPEWVCENYYLLENWGRHHNNFDLLGTPIACTFHDTSSNYDPRCKNIFNIRNHENEKFQLLIYLNPTVDKLLKFLFLTSENHVSTAVEPASQFKCRSFLEENAEALNNLYESLKRTYEAIENGNHFTGPQLTFRRGTGITTMYRH